MAKRIPIIEKIISRKEKKSKDNAQESGKPIVSNNSETIRSTNAFNLEDESPHTLFPFSEDEQDDSYKRKKHKPTDQNEPFEKVNTGHEARNSADPENTKNNPFEPAQSGKSTDTPDGHEFDNAFVSNKAEDQQPTSNPPPETEVTLTIDEEYTYFFVFGLTTAGKSAMLSGLIYYMETAGIGQTRPQGSGVHQKRGRFLINNMREKVESGEFVAGTPQLDKQNSDLVTEINLSFEPSHDGLPDLKLCLLEMAGEDLKKVKLQEGGLGGELDQRIDALLTHPRIELMFICVVDVDYPKRSQTAIIDFLNHLYDKGHRQNSLLLTVNKWDKVRDRFEDITNYLKVELPAVWNKLHDKNRLDVSYLDYSIGEVDVSNNTFVYKEKDSKRLFKWVYKKSTGEDYWSEEENSTPSQGKSKTKPSNTPWWQKILKRFEDER